MYGALTEKYVFNESFPGGEISGLVEGKDEGEREEEAVERKIYQKNIDP